MDRLRTATKAAGLSNGARNLLASLVLWSGYRGYCWWSLPRVSKELGRSVSSVRRWIRELERADLLQIVPDPGRASYMIPYPAEFSGPLSKVVGVSIPRKANTGAIGGGVFGEGKENLQDKTLQQEQPPQAVEISPTGEPKQPVNAFVIGPPEDPPTPVDEPEPVEAISARYRAPESVEPPVTASESAYGQSDQPGHPASTRTSRESKDMQAVVEQIEKTTGDTHSGGAFTQIARNVSEQDIYRCLSITRAAMQDQVLRRPGAYFVSVVKAITGFQFRGRSSISPAEKKPIAEPWCNLDQLQTMHAHIQVRELWKRYQQLVPDADLERYRLFLQCHHHAIWHQKPHYRRL